MIMIHKLCEPIAVDTTLRLKVARFFPTSREDSTCSTS